MRPRLGLTKLLENHTNVDSGFGLVNVEMILLGPSDQAHHEPGGAPELVLALTIRGLDVGDDPEVDDIITVWLDAAGVAEVLGVTNPERFVSWVLSSRG